MSEIANPMQAPPDAQREQARRVANQYARTHDLLDEYGIPRLNNQQIGREAYEARWLDLHERVQLLHQKTESWRQRAFQAERELCETTFQPDTSEDSDAETQPKEEGGITTMPEVPVHTDEVDLGDMPGRSHR